jgi:hypothetical protein
LFPVVVTVKVTEHVFGAPPESVQGDPLIVLPAAVVQLTVPVGVDVFPALVSVTVAVHVLVLSGLTVLTEVGEQVTFVLVARLEMVNAGVLVAPVRPALDAVSV